MSLLPVLGFLLYAGSAMAYAAVFRGRPAAPGRLARPLLVAGIAVQAGYLGLRASQLGTLPLTSFPDALSTVAASLALVYLYLELRQGTPMTGVFVLPIVALLSLLGALHIGADARPSELLRSPWFAVHVMTAVTSYCALSLAAVHGLLFLVLYHELKLGKFSLLYHRLPALQSLAQMTLRSTLVGFVLLGTSIAVGAGWLSGQLPAYLSDPNVLLNLLVWLVFGASIVAHYRWAQRGPLSVYLSLTGFAMLLVTAIMAVSFQSTFHRLHP